MGRTRRISNWYFMLVEGLLLVIFSFFVFTKPASLFAQLVNIAGILSVSVGVVVLFRYFFGEVGERNGVNILTSVMLIGMGVLLLTNANAATDWLLVVITGLFLLLAVQVFFQAWEIKYAFKWWGIAVVVVALSVLTAYLIISKTNLFGISFPIWSGLQVLSLGILMMWISLIDRRIGIEYKRTLHDLKNN